MSSWQVAINVVLHILQWWFTIYDINMYSAVSVVADADAGITMAL